MGVAMQCALSMIFLTQFTRMVRNDFFFSFWKFNIAICMSMYCSIPIDCIRSDMKSQVPFTCGQL